MARGDIKWFAAALNAAFTGGNFDLNGSDTVRLGIVTNVPVPTVNTPDPRWGAGGTTDLSANQVATATGYTGPITLGSVTFGLSSNVPTMDANDVTIPQDAGGFANGAYGIFYDATATGNRALGFLDLGGPVGNQNGPIAITFNAAGIFADTPI